jgi:hypothetical protein
LGAALPTLFAAVAPEAVYGGYDGPDGLASEKVFKVGTSRDEALDMIDAKRLFGGI